MALEELAGVKKYSFMNTIIANEKRCFIENYRKETSNQSKPLSLKPPSVAPPIVAPPSLSFSSPAESLNSFTSQNNCNTIFDHGTTTVGFVYQGGIVLCVDSRGSAGKQILSQTTRKVVPISDYMLSTMAGGAADCTYWDRVLSRESRLHELRHKERMTVNAAAQFICNIAAYYDGMGLMMGMMIAGWSDVGPALCYVDSEGSRADGHIFSVGSGCRLALPILDMGYRYNMSDQDADQMAYRSVYEAAKRDLYTGGIIRLYHVVKGGWFLGGVKDFMELHQEFEHNACLPTRTYIT
ncbi:hypothetical protein KR018_012172 [Drosophila ironensis]|nr:hypothetical protein KR018_012172 [Drosophila ironensis]